MVHARNGTEIDYSKGERIVECHTVHGVLWEIFIGQTKILTK